MTTPTSGQVTLDNFLPQWVQPDRAQSISGILKGRIKADSSFPPDLMTRLQAVLASHILQVNAQVAYFETAGMWYTDVNHSWTRIEGANADRLANRVYQLANECLTGNVRATASPDGSRAGASSSAGSSPPPSPEDDDPSPSPRSPPSPQQPTLRYNNGLSTMQQQNGTASSSTGSSPPPSPRRSDLEQPRGHPPSPQSPPEQFVRLREEIAHLKEELATAKATLQQRKTVRKELQNNQLTKIRRLQNEIDRLCSSPPETHAQMVEDERAGSSRSAEEEDAHELQFFLEPAADSAELAKLRARIQELELELQQKTGLVEGTRQLVARGLSIQNEVQTLQDTKAVLQMQINPLEMRLQQLEELTRRKSKRQIETLDQLKERIEKAKSQLFQAQQQIAEGTGPVAQLVKVREEISFLERHQQELEQQIAASRQEVEQQRAESVAQTMGIKRQLAVEQIELTEATRKLKLEIASLGEQKTALEEQHGQKITQLEQRKQELSQECEQLEQEVSGLQNKQQESAALSQRLREVKEQLALLQEQHKAKKAENERQIQALTDQRETDS